MPHPMSARSRASIRFRPFVAALALATPFAAGAQDRADDAAIAKFKDEGMNRSQIMETMSYLTDVYGPRLTGSPNIKLAADWAVKKMAGWGLANPHLEAWGPFGRGWSNERFSAQAISPQAYPLIAYPAAWTVGTDGPVTGEVVMAQIDSEADFARYKGKLRGKFIFTAPPPPALPAHFEPQGHRYTDAELADMAKPAAPPAAGGRPGGPRDPAAFAAAQALQKRKTQFYVDEGVAGLLQPGRGDDGTVFVSAGGSREVNAPPSVPVIVVAAEHYGRLYRTAQKGMPVTVEIDARNKFYDTDLNSFNVVAELPGTSKKDEVVMVGGHFDSWHTGTGATDNAAGSAVMMEALRILKASGLPMKRTVRIGLWSGEEEGLLGSRAYVTQHFGDRATMQLKPEHAKLAGYYNLDNGTGQIRGVYEQGNEAVGPIFTAWMMPFKDWGVGTVTPRNTGGTDHLSFDAVGLPGFQFIQDPIEYGTRTHHSNMDLYERIQPQDMMRNAVIVAAFVYQTANRDEKLPRKPLPTPPPAATQGAVPR